MVNNNLKSKILKYNINIFFYKSVYQYDFFEIPYRLSKKNGIKIRARTDSKKSKGSIGFMYNNIQ